MFSAKTFTVLILLMLFCLTSDCDAWRRRRRRRAPPPCPVKNCDITLWSYWSYCSTDQCGQQGSQSRSRTVVSEPSCGGTECPDNLSETRQCSGSKAVDCKLSHWSEWSGCTTVCGVLGTQSSVRHRITIEQCGGTCSSSLIKTRSCQQTGFDCHLSSWSEWGPCTTMCGVGGRQTSTRRRLITEQCGGTCPECPDNLFETRQCYGGNPVDCELSEWTSWSSCTTPCGASGTQSSSRHRVLTEKCGGTCSSSLSRTRSCLQTV
ncbi:unnamed protein product, partial [Pocillopora meandrina]